MAAKICPMDVLQVVAEPRRRQILRLIWDEERSAGDIADQFDVTFAAISQHLAVLRASKMVKMRKEGTRHFYVADRDALAPYEPGLRVMWADALGHMKEVIERDAAE